MRCTSCRAENTATRRFCLQCGSALPVPCPACGFEKEPAARFCGGCGTPIAKRTDSQDRRRLNSSATRQSTLTSVRQRMRSPASRLPGELSELEVEENHFLIFVTRCL